MKKIFALMIVLCLFSSCQSAGTPPRPTTITTVSGSADSAVPHKVVLAVDDDCEKSVITAAENFCIKTNSLFKDGFTLTLVKTADPYTALKTGKASIILLDGADAAQYDTLFKVTTSAFLYDSYEHFTMSLNSENVLDALSQSIGYRAIAAYYQGSNILASKTKLEKLLETTKQDKTATDAATGITAKQTATIPASKSASLFTLPRFNNSEIPLASERVLLLNEPDSIIELAPDEVAAQMFAPVLREIEIETKQDATDATTTQPDATLPDTTDTPTDDADDSNSDNPDETATQADTETETIDETIAETVYVTKSFHTATPLWLLMDNSLFQNLTPTGKAAIFEAVACMYGDIDAVKLMEESDNLAKIADDGDVTITSFALNQTIFKTPSPDYSAKQLDFFELISQLR